jgi:aspartate/methionine/tyrosine aminotransferase
MEEQEVRESQQVRGTDYIEWVKTRASARFNLALSGVMPYPLGELPVTIEDIELNGPSFYGYAPLQQALAAKCGVSADCVVAANGTSMANHLAMAALIEPGDEVLIEEPAYDPLLRVAEYLGARIKRFARRFDREFRIDVSEVERQASPRTRLIVITNLHNPSSAMADRDTLGAIGEIARRSKARVLVDEVYLEAMFEHAPRSAFHLGGEFVTTSSLTKAYGLGGLRCGWILAEPELAGKLHRLNDLFGVVPAHAAERLSVIALANIERISARARSLLEANRALVESFLDSRDDLVAMRPRFGTVIFPRLARGSVDSLAALLREKYETLIGPGKFFEMPEHFRLGLGIETETLAGGLERLGAALDEMAGKRA